MGNIILGVNTGLGYYFNNKMQSAVNAELTKAPYKDALIPAKALADAWNGVKSLVVDIVSIADNLNLVDHQVDPDSGILTLRFEYYGLKSSNLYRGSFNIDKVKQPFVTTSVLFVEQPQDGETPETDSGIHTTMIPDSDDVPGKGQPD